VVRFAVVDGGEVRGGGGEVRASGDIHPYRIILLYNKKEKENWMI
jgi:hypothetical protein